MNRVTLQNPIYCQHVVDETLYCKQCHSFILAIFFQQYPNPIHQLVCFYRSRLMRKYVHAYVEDESKSGEQLALLMDNDFFENN